MFKNISESHSAKLNSSLRWVWTHKHTQFGLIWPDPAHWWLKHTICGLIPVKSSPWQVPYFHFFVCWNYAKHLLQQITYLKQSHTFAFVKMFFATRHRFLNAFCHRIALLLCDSQRGVTNRVKKMEQEWLSWFSGEADILFYFGTDWVVQLSAEV